MTLATPLDLPSGDDRLDLDHPAELKVWKIRVPHRLSMPEVDHAFIETCLHLEDCEARVAAHHRSLFHWWSDVEIEQAAQNRDMVHHYIRGLERRRTILSEQILRTDELLKQEQEAAGTVAWSTVDRF